MEPQFPGNSKKAKASEEKQEKKVIEKVVVGEVVQKKPPILQRIKNTFFAGDVDTVAKYLVQEVLLPAFRNLIVDSTTKGIEKMMYGDNMAPRYSAGSRSRYSYNKPVQRDQRPRVMLPDQPPHPPPRSRHATPELIVSSKSEGDLVIERLVDIIDTYEVASIADLYDLLGLPNSYIDNKWGWTQLAYADVRQVREGFLIELPPADPI
jgi:hypothetical protein